MLSKQYKKYHYLDVLSFHGQHIFNSSHNFLCTAFCGGGFPLPTFFGFMNVIPYKDKETSFNFVQAIKFNGHNITTLLMHINQSHLLFLSKIGTKLITVVLAIVKPVANKSKQLKKCYSNTRHSIKANAV